MNWLLIIIFLGNSLIFLLLFQNLLQKKIERKAGIILIVLHLIVSLSAVIFIGAMMNYGP